jgi:hypothetical protein
LRFFFPSFGNAYLKHTVQKITELNMYNEIISRNFVKTYGFKNITGTLGFFLSNFGNFYFFQKIFIHNSFKISQNFGKFQLRIDSVSQTRTLYLVCMLSIEPLPSREGSSLFKSYRLLFYQFTVKIFYAKSLLP